MVDCYWCFCSGCFNLLFAAEYAIWCEGYLEAVRLFEYYICWKSFSRKIFDKRFFVVEKLKSIWQKIFRLGEIEKYLTEDFSSWRNWKILDERFLRLGENEKYLTKDFLRLREVGKYLTKDFSSWWRNWKIFDERFLRVWEIEKYLTIFSSWRNWKIFNERFFLRLWEIEKYLTHDFCVLEKLKNIWRKNFHMTGSQ